MFQRILVPLDGSQRAEQALPFAAHIARACGGTIILLRVSTPEVFSGLAVDSPIMTSALFEAEHTVVSDYLTGLASWNILRGFKTTTCVAKGRPAEAILSTTDDLRAELVVMCSHGRTGIKRWVLGSVAQHVARHSRVPVLIVREGADNAHLHVHPNRPFCVMVALDGSPLAEEAITPAAQLSAAASEGTEGELHLVHVVHLPVKFEYGQDDALAAARQEGLQEAKTYLSEVKQRVHTNLSNRQIQITSAVAVSMDIADTLIQIAEGNRQKDSTGCDVIALTTHGYTGPKRWIIGSVAERILGATTLPLLIVHAQKSQEQYGADDVLFAASTSMQEDTMLPSQLYLR